MRQVCTGTPVHYEQTVRPCLAAASTTAAVTSAQGLTIVPSSAQLKHVSGILQVGSEARRLKLS